MDACAPRAWGVCMTALAAGAGGSDRVLALHVFGWIVDSGLGDSLKGLAHSLLRRVDSGSFRWPRRHGAPGGVTVADLADGAGVSRRHAARCLRHLESMGLVRTIFRPFEVSEYQLLVEAWKSRAETHRKARQQARDRSRLARIAAFNQRRAAVLGRPVAAPPAQPAPPPAPAADSLPDWARRHARRYGVAPGTVFAAVGGAAAAILGDGVAPEAQGGLARPVLRLWDGRGRPDPAQLAAELKLVAAWARESIHPAAVALRGQARRGDLDRSSDPRSLCDAARFEQRLDAARQHDRARSAPSPSPVVAPARAEAPEPPIPRRGDPPWIPAGQPAFLPGIGPRADALVDAWQAALARLRGSEEHDRGAIDIFLAPLRPVALQAGVVVVAAPSADGARWIGRHLTDELSELARLIGAPIGFVVETVDAC